MNWISSILTGFQFGLIDDLHMVSKNASNSIGLTSTVSNRFPDVELDGFSGIIFNVVRTAALRPIRANILTMVICATEHRSTRGCLVNSGQLKYAKK